jgi:hypothetical protein
VVVELVDVLVDELDVELVVVVVVVGETLRDPTVTADVCRVVPPFPN